MAIQDNSPTRTNIRWSNLKLIHEGMIYAIKDGFTNNKYVYWKKETPNQFITGDMLPRSNYQIVMMNNDGVAYLYPSVELIIDNAGQQKQDNIVLVNHISNQDIHTSLEEKELLTSLEEASADLYEQINLLARRINEVRLKTDKTDENVSINDRRVTFLEESMEILFNRVDELEKSLQEKQRKE